MIHHKSPSIWWNVTKLNKSPYTSSKLTSIRHTVYYDYNSTQFRIAQFSFYICIEFCILTNRISKKVVISSLPSWNCWSPNALKYHLGNFPSGWYIFHCWIIIRQKSLYHVRVFGSFSAGLWLSEYLLLDIIEVDEAHSDDDAEGSECAISDDEIDRVLSGLIIFYKIGVNYTRFDKYYTYSIWLYFIS